MALYSFITKKCNADIQKHGLVDSVTKYAAKIEYDQSTGSVDLYPHPFLKRNIRKHYRLIIEERRVGEDVVYCFLCVFQRSDSDYAQFMSLSNQGKLHLFIEKYAPSQQEVQVYLSERRTQNRVEPLPDLSPVEHTYLMGITSASEGPEQTIIESRTWVDRISQNIKPSILAEYFSLIESLLWDSELDPSHTIIGQGKYWILYRYFPKIDKLFLVAPLDPKERDKDEVDLLKKYDRIFTANERTANQIIREEGLRSYPGIVTADKELWLDIQDSKEANLSLSPEEMDVLNSVLKPSGIAGNHTVQEAIYPLFINGRPGSGKSTILLYLFAEYLHFHLKQIWTHKTNRGVGVLERPPIYLTYSESLLKDARRIVHDILRCDGKKAQSLYELTDYDIKQTIENSFANFRTFLRSALPIAERIQFPPQNFVDFPHFRRVFIDKTSQESNSKTRALSPEIAWHVIRTYIKGMRQQSQAYLDVDSYEHELPRKQQTVTRSTFELVFTEVWEKFYKPYCETEGYWDDQDLARKLLDLAEEGQIELSQFPAIFCDESQDFTKIELELVFHLSRFSKRNIKLNELHSVLPRIPFAFAGDPFQTLNPTGFDWNATKAFFHNSIVRPLDPAGRAELNFNYQELEFNYRSAQPIVQFCNLIQLMRGRAFNIKNIKPQKTWQIRPSLDPVYYDIAQAGCQQVMQTQQALIYIVPCQEGEEEAFVKQDSFLRRVAWNEEEQIVTRDVLSPVRAKGLQFQRVVLYKFGEHALDIYQDQINLLLDPFIDRTGNGKSPLKEDTLPLEYFVNHLYVAASRPRQQLIVVDSKRALDNFWAFAIEGDQQALIYSYTTEQEWNQENITRLAQGTRESWYQIKDNALTLGHNFFSKGQEMRDPYFLDRARQNFIAAGERELADQALALKLYYNGRLQEAGVVYARLKKYNNALACFWQSSSYKQIIALQSSIASKNPKQQLIFQVSTYMVGDKPIKASLACIEYIHESMSSYKEIEQSIIKGAQWTQIVQEIVEQTALEMDKNQDTHISLQEWKKTWSQLSDMLKQGMSISDKISLARVANAAEEYKISRDLLTSSNVSPTKEAAWTTRVFAESSPYPENIRWLSQLNLHRRVIEVYENNQSYSPKDQTLDNQGVTLVFNAYLYEQEYSDARSFLALYPGAERYQTLLFSLAEKERYHLANQILLDVVHFYVLTAKWEPVLELVLALPGLPEGISEANHQLMVDPTKVHAFLIRKLARSEALQRELSMSHRAAISDYLKAQLFNPSTSIQTYVKLQEAGAAFERAGIFRDTLNFYESIINHAQNQHEELIQWAEIRWIKTKLRQAGSLSTDQERNEALQFATAKLSSWEIPKDKIQSAPTFPHLSPLEELILPVEEAPILEPGVPISTPQPVVEASVTEDVIVPAEKNGRGASIALPVWKEIPDYANSSGKKPKTDSDKTLPELEKVESRKTTNGSSTSIEPPSLPAEASNQDGPQTNQNQGVALLDDHDTSSNGVQVSSVESEHDLPDNDDPINDSNETGDHVDESTNKEASAEEILDTTSEALDVEDVVDRKDESTEEKEIDTPLERKALPDSHITSAPSPAIRIPDNTPVPPPYIKEVPIKVSLSIEIGNAIFECQLIHHLRVFEMRNQMTQERIDILAAVQDVRDSYGILNIQKRELDDSEKSSWIIPEWSLMIQMEDQGETTNIGLLHSQSGKVIVHLQL